MNFAQANAGALSPILVLALFFVIIILLVVFMIVLSLGKPWMQAFMSNSGVSFFDLIGMRLRKVNVNVVVNCRIMTCVANHPVGVQELEKAYLSGADVPLVTRAYLDAKKLGKEFTFQELVDANLADDLNRLLKS